MLEVPVYNTSGEKIDALKVDEDVFGGKVNVPLLKQAIVSYHANSRVGTAATKTRAEVAATTHKFFRQKGTGNARRGSRDTNLLRGGGTAFAKKHRDFRKGLPRKMRKSALNAAILAKIIAGDLMVLDSLAMDVPKTRDLAAVMKNLKINRSCLLALAERDRNVYLSSRNIADLMVRVTAELNAFDVATRRKMLVTAEAMRSLTGQEAKA